MAETLNEYGLPLRRRERQHDEGNAPELAVQEQARRVLARRRFLPFIMRNDPDFQAAWFHKIVCAELEKFSEAIANKESPRLIIMAPPRHGKSELVSRNFPSWHLGRYPDHEFIACSYGADLARDFSRKVRGMLVDSGYNTVFPDVELDPDSRSADRWNIEGHAGGYVAAGAGGPITGRGMNCGVIDDYVKNAEEADSASSRDKLWKWYESTFKTRMAPGGGIIVMATRWHDDDLIGRILKDEGRIEDGGKWKVLEFAAEAIEDEYYEGERIRKKGEALHPERYSIEFFEQFKRNARVWWALFQQKPVQEEGGYFQEGNFKTYRSVERPPLDELHIISTWDFAVGQKENNDYTVGAIGGVDQNYRVWALDQFSGKWDSMETVEKIIEVYRLWEPDDWGFEHGQISLAIGPFLNRRLIEESIWDIDISDPEVAMKTGRRDKMLRARPLQGFIRTGHFLFPEESAWYRKMLDEFLLFPQGEHDDQVDAWAWMAQKADQFITKGAKPKPKKLRGKWQRKTLEDRMAEFKKVGGAARGWLSS